jgi:hypothetical protein
MQRLLSIVVMVFIVSVFATSSFCADLPAASQSEKIGDIEKTETGVVKWETFYGTNFLEVKKTVIQIGKSKVLISQYIQLTKGEIEVDAKTGNPVLYEGDKFVMLMKFETKSTRPLSVPFKSVLSGDDSALILEESRFADKKTDSLLDRGKNQGAFVNSEVVVPASGTILVATYGNVKKSL